MTALLIAAAWLLVAIPASIVLGLSIKANSRPGEDATYVRLCSASFGARIPMNVDHDRPAGVWPWNDTARPGLQPSRRPGPASSTP